jgi:hypothetical protein
MMSFIGSGLFAAVMFWSLFIVFSNAVTTLAFWSGAVTLMLVSFFSTAKSALRLRAVGLSLSGYKDEIRNQRLPQFTLWLITPVIFLVNCLAALVSRKITWRGITYQMISPTDTRVLDPRSGQ